jgi:uncharacterized damage-inducible protein DinB
MNFYGAKELAESFRTVRKNTVQIATDISDAHYQFRATPETRSVGEQLLHIAVSTRFPERIHKIERRTSMEGLDFPALLAAMKTEEQAVHTKEQTIELLRTNGEQFAHWLEGLSDDFLAERVTLPIGSPKTRFEMLLSTKEHEMHHRGQLMLIERMIGIVPHLTREMEARMAQMQQTARA